mmetsp:Transcript_42284/g.75728  ORF Transcript_42284/g.75728 Transcript_42284/m.75728 type:complete len:104 (+) Transcript_42284:1-312(+)
MMIIIIIIITIKGKQHALGIVSSNAARKLLQIGSTRSCKSVRALTAASQGLLAWLSHHLPQHLLNDSGQPGHHPLAIAFACPCPRSNESADRLSNYRECTSQC